LPALRGHVPTKFNRYFEPFLGGGAFFFDLWTSGKLAGKRVFLSDRDPDLINCFRAVRDDIDGVIGWVRYFEGAWIRRTRKLQEAYYYEVRDELNKQDPDEPRTCRAAKMIFLNRTGFNGVWRVNAKGEYNVPVGRPSKADGSFKILDEENLRACSRALRGVVLRKEGFQKAFARMKKGDFCYADCPYWPRNTTTADFTSYTKDGFSSADQKALELEASAAHMFGVRVLLSNAAVTPVRQLYLGWKTQDVNARRSVNSKTTARGPVGELLIW
jgi:DNA adenine methylase